MNDPEFDFFAHAAPLIGQLDATAARFAQSLAMVSGDRRLDWAQVQTESRSLARGLMAMGIGRGDHIALWLPNRPDWLLLWLAAMRVGAAVVPINTRYKSDEAEYVLRKSEAKALFIEPAFLKADFIATFNEICPDWDGSHSDVLPDLNAVVLLRAPEGDRPDGFGLLDEIVTAGAAVSEADLDTRTASLDPQDRVIVVFTSGTTGRPKGVMHTHDTLRMMQTVSDWMGIGPEDRILGHLPLFHVAGVFSSFLLGMIKGSGFVQMDAWDPQEALDLIVAEKVSVLSGIPTHFIDLLRHPGLADHDVSSLRTGWIGGATIPSEVVAGAADKLGMDALLPVYGMTETTSCTTLARPGDTRASIEAGRGVPLGGYDVQLVDPETREPLPAGQEGEIRVRGYPVMKGYFRDEDATAKVLDADGWFHTGDLGVFDADGYMKVTGRRSDLFIVGGNNVHPADIEHVLLALPEIKQAHVVAGPDDRLGEVAVAFVELTREARAQGRMGAEEVIAHCRGKLASFKVPRRVVFLEDWPMTPTGKVQRFKLRQMAAETG